MRRFLPAAAFLALALPFAAAAVTLPELFLKAKEQFKLGNYAQSLATLEILDAESAKPGMETERQKLLAGLLFYKGACLAALDRRDEALPILQSFLVLQPGAHLDPAVYPPKVVAALEAARNAAALEDARKSADAPRNSEPEDTGVLATSYRAFRMPESKPAEDTGDAWADGPAKYLLTGEERKAFQSISDPAARSEFILGFWKSRDPKPETPANEFRDEFERRVAFADTRFAQDEVRGSLTDRGMAFILLGPPNYSGKRPLTTADDQGAADASGLSRYGRAEIEAAYHTGGKTSDRMARIARVTGPDANIHESASNWIEVWHYLRSNLPKEVPYQELALQFVTKAGYGKNVLQRDANVLSAIERAKGVARRGEIISEKPAS